ncbi:MAG: acyl-CoA dehydrogenase family protein, partial [Pseudomonadota bacterium]
GSKRWTTLGPDGSLFFVAARDEAASGERVSIKVVRVPSGSKGIEIEEMPPTKFVPEVPHARLRFENVSVKGEDLLPGDGYDSYVKPFRTVEDLHVNAAILAYLVREARRLGWRQDWIERAVTALFALERLSGEDPSAPATHIALAGTLAITSTLFQESESFWNDAGADPAAQRWRRDRELLKVAGSAREARTARAWERLGVGVPT